MVDSARVKDSAPRWLLSAADRATREYAMATVRHRPAPDFLVIGTKRGGTTSLFNYLMMHPAVLGLFPQARGKKSTDYFFKEQHRGEHWYRSHFHSECRRRVLARRVGVRPLSGEASPYYMYDPRVAPLAHRLNPALRAIVLLRDPVERAWSHHQERTHMGVEPLSFADALEAEGERTSGEHERMLADPTYYSSRHDWYSYRDRGVYLPQLRNWEAVFPREQMLVLVSEEMYADVQGTVDTVSRFLGLPDATLPTTKTFNRITTSAIPSEVRTDLAKFYSSHNEALAEHLGRPLPW